MIAYLLAYFALLNATDGWTTWQVLRFGGVEVMPWLVWLMAKIGRYNTLLLVKIAPPVAVWVMATYGIAGSVLGVVPLAAICACYTLVVVSNYHQLQKQKAKG